MNNDLKKFQENVDRFAKTSKGKAEQLKKLRCQHVTFFQNSNGELNLRKKLGEETIALHSQESIADEANRWYSSLQLQGISVLFVYGVGLGYYYDVAKPWLKESDEHFLVFLEDDLEVIHRLFETDKGRELLADHQVILRHFESLDWECQSLKSLLYSFPLKKYEITALEQYGALKGDIFQQLKAGVAFHFHKSEGITLEQINFGGSFFQNFYRNILKLPEAYLGNALYEKFFGCPAIICGAGPSLQKNIDILKTLKGRALIFAGSTAINALNAEGITPHFGVGIDPNWHQYARLLANTSFNMPLFYRNRLNHEALKVVHGDHLFVTGAGGYEIAGWFEEKLQILQPSLSEGTSVANFSLSLTHALGCNPIIFVGMDLAYTDQQSYASGIVSHGLHDRKHHFKTKKEEDELIVRTDIYGKPVNTLWKWIGESIWFGQYAQEVPYLVLLNATEGGIGFPNVPNFSLQEVADVFLKNQYDFETMIHGEIQNSQMPESVTKEHVIEAISEMKLSLEKCKEHCVALHHSFSHQSDQGIFDDKLEELEVEPAYSQILHQFDQAYRRVFGWQIELMRAETEIEEKKILEKKTEYNAKRYAFLEKGATYNLQIIEVVLGEAKKSPPTEQRELEKPQPKKSVSQEHYSYEGEVLKIIDPELKLAIDESFVPQKTEEKLSGQYLSHYPSGAVKLEQYYLEQHLHGPSTYYSETGGVLARSWHYHGVQLGKTWRYYLSGELHSLLRYREGVFHGKQEIYYQNGHPKSSLNYADGVLNGEVCLYYPNGKLKRELHFSKGKRSGAEKMWSELGMLILDAAYKNDLPIGTIRSWHENGRLAKEVTYDENSERKGVKQWDREGVLLPEEEYAKKDYFDTVTEHTETLTDALEDVIKQIGEIAPVLGEEEKVGLTQKTSSEIQDDFALLQQEMENLRKLQKEMQVEVGPSPEKTEEIWKNPESQKEVEQKLKEATDQMSQDFQAIQEAFLRTVKELGKKLKDEGNSD